jgi:hypothetical protein
LNWKAFVRTITVIFYLKLPLKKGFNMVFDFKVGDKVKLRSHSIVTVKEIIPIEKRKKFKSELFPIRLSNNTCVNWEGVWSEYGAETGNDVIEILKIKGATHATTK